MFNEYSCVLKALKIVKEIKNIILLIFKGETRIISFGEEIISAAGEAYFWSVRCTVLFSWCASLPSANEPGFYLILQWLRASPVSCLRKNPPIDKRQGRSADWQMRSRKSRHDGLIKRNRLHDHLLQRMKRCSPSLLSSKSLARYFLLAFYFILVIRAVECSIRDDLATKTFTENHLDTSSLIKDLAIIIGTPMRISYFRHIW